MEPYSVLMSVYVKEKPEYLEMAIDSMVYQTVKPDEIVIVEDGPLSNELYGVLDKYESKYPMIIRRCRNEINLGLGMALNNGLAVCKNELIARMDSDDISRPERCELQLKRFKEKPELSIVGTHIDEFIGDIDHVVSSRKVPLTNENIFEFGKRRTPFNHVSVMYRKSAVLKAGGYFQSAQKCEDIDLWGRMLSCGCKGENIDRSLVWVRFEEDALARRKGWKDICSYIVTIKNFWRMGYSSFWDFVLVLIVQFLVFLLPVSVLGIIYKKFLRE